jgi:signal transduction histidine kinase
MAYPNPVVQKTTLIPHQHFVQFYEQDDFLLDEVSGFLSTGLEAGHAGIVIATPQHLDGLKQRLNGFARDGNRYFALDAATTLSTFMVDGWPDEQLFKEVLGRVIRGATQNGTRQVRAFGEMVSLLWAEGKHEAACRLEELWNDLAASHSFSLLCAYPMGGFHAEEHGDSFLHICNAHSQVRPAESFKEAADEEALHRRIALLQQKAAALQSEVAKRVRLEMDLKKKVEQLAEIDQRKDAFLAMLGHELRNPLGAITTAVELMRLVGEDPVRLTRSREIVARQAVLMKRLVDDLLDISRVNQGRIVLKTEEVLLETIVERAVETVRPLIDERGHRLTVELPAEPVLLLGDPERLVQVVANLLNNAAKYTDAGGNLELSARTDATNVLLCVRDDGIGLTADLRERMFEPFVQAEGSRERAQGGLGIGLALVRNLIALHGGCIEARSEGLGRGSELVVCLPLPLSPV